MNRNNKKQIELDLFVDPRELTQTEKNLLSEYISKDKLKNKATVIRLSNRSHQNA